MALDGRERASRAPDLGDVVEGRQAVEAITQAPEQPPRSLRDLLLASMQVLTVRVIAEDLGYSQSTAHPTQQRSV